MTSINEDMVVSRVEDLVYLTEMIADSTIGQVAGLGENSVIYIYQRNSLLVIKFVQPNLVS